MNMNNLLVMMNESYPILYMLASYLLFFVGLVLLWFIVSYPFLLVRGAVGEVLSKFILWTENSQIKLQDSAKKFYELFSGPFDKLIQESRYRYILDEEEVKINQELQDIKQNIDGTLTETKSIGVKVTASLNTIKGSLEKILGINTPPEYPLKNIQVPSMRIERNVDQIKREGFIKFMIFVPVGFLLIILNTFLLEKFFTIFTSEYIMYSLGIKYSHLIALFYSIAELALGVGFVFSKNNRSFQVMILIFIACLAFLEVYIYLYLGLQFAGFEFSDMATLRGWEILEASWMSPFGLAISGVLFIAGHFVTDGILEYRRGQDLEIFKNEFVYLIGPSGAGKSTLLKLIFKEDDPSQGDIVIDQYLLRNIHRRQLPYLRRHIGIIFQDYKLLPRRTVYENVAFALRVMHVPQHKIRRQVYHVLDLVGLQDKAHFMPKELSGGEQQKICIARAIVNHPPILLCDEPTGNLDPETSWEIVHLLSKINAHNTTIIMATHDTEIVDGIPKRVIAVEKGMLARDQVLGTYVE